MKRFTEYPIDAISAIVSRLHPADACRMKILSRKLKEMISNRGFILQSATCARNLHKSTIIRCVKPFSGSNPCSLMMVGSIGNPVEEINVSILKDIQQSSEEVEIVGVSNGLICLYVQLDVQEGQFVVINPLTCQSRVVYFRSEHTNQYCMYDKHFDVAYCTNSKYEQMFLITLIISHEFIAYVK